MIHPNHYFLAMIFLCSFVSRLPHDCLVFLSPSRLQHHVTTPCPLSRPSGQWFFCWRRYVGQHHYLFVPASCFEFPFSDHNHTNSVLKPNHLKKPWPISCKWFLWSLFLQLFPDNRSIELSCRHCLTTIPQPREVQSISYCTESNLNIKLIIAK